MQPQHLLAAPRRSFGASRGRLPSRSVEYARCDGWKGPRQISPAAMAFMARFAFTTRTRTTPRPTSRGPLPLIFILIVNGLTDYNTRRCGAPAGSKRRKKRLSSVIFHGFWPFSRRERSQLLPRLLLSVVRLLLSLFVTGFVARGCPSAELRAVMDGHFS